jgi:two-component system phosphate regulon sensor histidine kinase PhoR
MRKWFQHPKTATRRPFGVRLYLAFAFAGVALITAGLAYLLVNETGQTAADERLDELAQGRTVGVAIEVGDRREERAADALRVIAEDGYSVWVFDDRGKLVTDRVSDGLTLDSVPQWRQAVRQVLGGRRYVASLPDGVTVVGTQIYRDSAIDGAVLARAERPPELQEAIEAVRGDRLFALGIALAVSVLISFLIASAITSRVKRLAMTAGRIAEGHLDEPIEVTGGRDEITDLGIALETMRAALRQTFDALRSERDRLSAIFDALTDGVMVVAADGTVRFSNPAAQPLVYADGKAAATLLPWLRRAQRTGAAEHDSLRIGDRVWSLQAREIPAEKAVLAVVRDRTDELRREIAEREFVSNAAHELRNPIAAISGAIEVLRAGAKDDPEAREHFLRRLHEDTERIARLTESLLILAREAFDVGITAEEAAQAVEPPEGVEFEVDIEPDLVAEGDRVLLRQVLIGLLTNAFKHTQPPGTVTLRARRHDDGDVLIEVTDTGTGIPADEIDRIFERFYRGATARELEGFGLGLSIAKRMVDVMGGQIGVDSQVGRGSDFWVRLPAAKPAATPVA